MAPALTYVSAGAAGRQPDRERDRQMARIRADLVGAIHVGGVVLMAGDEVPPGVKIHTSRLDAADISGGDANDGVLAKPHHAAGVATWRAYADQIGATYAPDADKAAIRAAVAEVEDADA